MNSDQPIESLLKQLSLKNPSHALDEKVEAICCSVNQGQRGGRIEAEPNQPLTLQTDPATTYSVATGQNRGWLPFAATALVASLAGFVIGQFITLDPNLGSRASSIAAVVTEAGNSSQVMQGNLTPVKFNVNAFRLLHGHSQQDEFASCKQCHTGDLEETSEKFNGWFYGDKEFFQKHIHSDISKCSDCHRIASDETPPPKFEHFKDSNCSTCHALGKPGKKKPST